MNMKVNYEITPDQLPVEMLNELREAITADVAENVYNDWSHNKGIHIDRRERGHLWVMTDRPEYA